MVLRETVRLNGLTDIALTKLDVLQNLPALQICVAYELDGKRLEYLPQEEGALAGGFSSAVLEFLNDHGLLRGQRIRRLGLPDSFVEHGKQLQLRELVGLRSRGIARAAMELAREY